MKNIWIGLVLMCAVDWTGFSLDAELFPGLDETGIAIVVGIALLRRW